MATLAFMFLVNDRLGAWGWSKGQIYQNYINFVSHMKYILEDFENASPHFALFLQTVYAIEKLLARFNVQFRIGMNQSLT